MSALVLGPMLRHTDETSAAIWVETDAPCRVEVTAAGARHRAHTVTVHGHHYALVEVSGLAPGSVTPYEVALDGQRAWPPPRSTFPPSCIRTVDPCAPVRLVFGSCRTYGPHDPSANRVHGPDALRAYGMRLARGEPAAAWPTAVLMLGDQVYADETPAQMTSFLHRRRGEIERRSGSRAELPPVGELADFTDYTEIYRLAWSEEATRWLLSTVPTLMIFDDHDIRDDWNTSASWREKMAAQPWWRARIVGGLGSYWIYQHLGNLSGPERETDELWSALRAADGDAGDLLDAFATDADACPQRHRWSFARDIGRTRLIMLDSRATRVLEPGSRAIMDAEEWAWFDRQARTDGGQIDHVLIGTSLPYLLPIGVHDLEAWNEAVADGAWGARAARAAEAIRQGIDLEHWSAFHRSFDAMATAVTELATGARGRAPASIVFLSGDVHYSYRARAHLPVPHPGAVHQLVSSPMRNPLPRAVRWAHGVASFGVARLAGAAPELTVQARARLT